jgi:hypothetical protein
VDRTPLGSNVKEKLLQGYQVGDKTFKNHLDGYNFTPFSKVRSPPGRATNSSTSAFQQARRVARLRILHSALQYLTMYLCASRHTENAFLKPSSCWAPVCVADCTCWLACCEACCS